MACCARDSRPRVTRARWASCSRSSARRTKTSTRCWRRCRPRRSRRRRPKRLLRLRPRRHRQQRRHPRRWRLLRPLLLLLLRLLPLPLPRRRHPVTAAGARAHPRSRADSLRSADWTSARCTGVAPGAASSAATSRPHLPPRLRLALRPHVRPRQRPIPPPPGTSRTSRSRRSARRSRAGSPSRIGPIPTFFLTADFDLTSVRELRTRMIALGDEFKVSYNDIILKAVATALSQHPEVNAHWLGDRIRHHHRVHLGMAVAVEDGLITPIICGCGHEAHPRDRARFARARQARARAQAHARGVHRRHRHRVEPRHVRHR